MLDDGVTSRSSASALMVDSQGIRVERRLIADCAESAATVRCRDLTIESLPGKKTSVWRVKTGIPLKAVMEQETFDRARAAALGRQVGVDFGASLRVALAYVGDRLGDFKLMAALNRGGV
jgi:hypothetical protein